MSREPGEAPGLEWKRRSKDGVRIPRWRARKKAVALGYRPSVIQLDIDPDDHTALAERCHVEWMKMEAWLANERPAPVFDGTLASLSRRDEYQADAYARSNASAADLVRALLKLYEDNASTLTPDPVYVRFYYSHPPASSRIAALGMSDADLVGAAA